MRKHCQWCKMQNLFLSVLLYWQVFYWMQSILLWSSVFIYFPPQISHNSYNLGLFAGFNNSLRTPVMCWEILLSRLRQFYQGFKSRLLLSWVNFFLTEWFYNAISWKSSWSPPTLFFNFWWYYFVCTTLCVVWETLL